MSGYVALVGRRCMVNRVSRRADSVGEVGSNGPKVPEIPREDDLSLDLNGATEEERVIDATAREALFRGQRNRAVIFVLIEGHDRTSIASLLDEEQRLVGRNDLLYWQGSHTG